MFGRLPQELYAACNRRRKAGDDMDRYLSRDYQEEAVFGEPYVDAGTAVCFPGTIADASCFLDPCCLQNLGVNASRTRTSDS